MGRLLVRAVKLSEWKWWTTRRIVQNQCTITLWLCYQKTQGTTGSFSYHKSSNLVIQHISQNKAQILIAVYNFSGIRSIGKYMLSGNHWGTLKVDYFCFIYINWQFFIGCTICIVYPKLLVDPLLTHTTLPNHQQTTAVQLVHPLYLDLTHCVLISVAKSFMKRLNTSGEITSLFKTNIHTKPVTFYTIQFHTTLHFIVDLL